MSFLFFILIGGASIIFISFPLLIVAFVLSILSFLFYSDLTFKNFLENSKKITDDSTLIYLVAEKVLKKLEIYSERSNTSYYLNREFKKFIANPETLDKSNMMIYRKIIEKYTWKKI